MKAELDTLQAIQSGDQNAFAKLLLQYQPLIHSMAQSFSASCPDVEWEDLLQEASLALSDAAQSFRLDSTEVTFGLYAKICIRNRLISVGRKYRAKTKPSKVKAEKSKPMQKRLSLPKDFSLAECRARLSPFENKVLTLYADGRSYVEIAQELACGVKSIDNALYRIKRKIRDLFQS